MKDVKTMKLMTDSFTVSTQGDSEIMDISSEAKMIEQKARDNTLVNLADHINKIREGLATINKALEQ